MDILGVDVGGVIIDRANDNTDTSFFSGNYLNSRPVEGAIEAIARLVKERFNGNAYIVSKCGSKTEAKTKHWLLHNGIYERTGIKEGSAFFCRQRPEKAPICKEKGITHFIDDRMSVLKYMDSVPHKYLFQPSPEELADRPDLLKSVVVVNSWAEVLRQILPPDGT